jgi:hypothetical protein
MELGLSWHSGFNMNSARSGKTRIGNMATTEKERIAPQTNT